MSKGRMLLVGGLILVAAIFLLQNKKPNGQSSSATTRCEIQVTADNLNVRAAPDGKAPVVGQYKKGAITAATATVQNGYRQLDSNRWVLNQFLQPVTGAC